MPSFAQNPNAYCRWAKAHESRVEALSLLAKPLRDDSWRSASAEWVRHLSWPPFWEPTTRSAALELRSALISKILVGPLDDSAHAALPGIFNTRSLAPIPEAAAITTWVVDHAEPNDAAMIADMIEHVVYDKDDDFKRACVPLVEWLLTKGSSELRSGRRALLVAQLVPFVLEYGPPDLVAPTIRYVLFNDKRVGSDTMMFNTVERLLTAIEQVIATTGSGSIVGDLVEALEPNAVALYVQEVLGRWEQHPLSRLEVLRQLAEGSIQPPDAASTWALAMLGPPVDLRMVDEPVARSAAEGLVRRITDHGSLGVEAPEHPDRREWGRVVAREFTRATAVLSTRSTQDVRLLQRCAGFDPQVTEGVHDAVLNTVEAANEPGLDAMRSMLRSPGTGPNVVSAALELLLGTKDSNPGTGDNDGSLDHVLDAIRMALKADAPTVCGFNFAEAVQRATDVEAKTLAGDRAFLVEGKTLLVSERALRDLLTVSDHPHVQRALGVLYAIHEVVHDFQGIAEKTDVSRVRFAGAESALMHVDLGADHVATVIAATMFPEWDLLWLKDWAGRSIPAFPAGPRNPEFSRIRKTLRFIGLRTDLVLRKLGVGTELFTSESYGFADYSPGGGAFIAIVNRPPFVVVKNSTISSADAAILFSGIDGGVIEKVDQVIERALIG